jgi:hypothetical protein
VKCFAICIHSCFYSGIIIITVKTLDDYFFSHAIYIYIYIHVYRDPLFQSGIFSKVKIITDSIFAINIQPHFVKIIPSPIILHNINSIEKKSCCYCCTFITSVLSGKIVLPIYTIILTMLPLYLSSKGFT